jgi:hypothetical protein
LADRACNELRAHGIKCDIVEPALPYLASPFRTDPEIDVVVAPEDEDRANDVRDGWASSIS